MPLPPTDATVVATARPAQLRSLLQRCVALIGPSAGGAVDALVRSVDSWRAGLSDAEKAALVGWQAGTSIALVPRGGASPELHLGPAHADTGSLGAYLLGAASQPSDPSSWLEAHGDGESLRALMGEALGLAKEAKQWRATVGARGDRVRVALVVELRDGGPLARWVASARVVDKEAHAATARGLGLLPNDLAARASLASHALASPWFHGLGSVAAALGGEDVPAPPLAELGTGPLSLGLAWGGEGPTLLARRAVPDSDDDALRAVRHALETARTPSFGLRTERTRVSGISADVVRLRVEDRRGGPKAAGAPRALALAATVLRGWLLAAAGHSPLDGLRALHEASGRAEGSGGLATRAADVCTLPTPVAMVTFTGGARGGAADARADDSGAGACLSASAADRTLALDLDLAR